MSVMKLTFDIEEADRLRRNIGQVSQDTNRLYMQFKGQAGNWNGIPLGSSLQQAQVLLNELTVEAERLEDLIRTAVKGVQNVQEENKQRTNQLMQQFSMLGVLFGRLDGSAASGRMGIPALAQAAVMKLITSVSILSGRDELSHDPAVQKLQGVMKAAAFGSVDWFAAQIKLTEIYEARNQIAKAQTAYGVYQAFGNRTQMEAVHQSAEAARQKLESLGVNKLQYEPGKDLSGYFKQAAVQACDNDPSITAGSVPLLQDEAYQLLLRMAMEPGIPGEWAKSQLPSKRLEVQLAQTAKILAAKVEAEQRLAGPPVKLPDGTPITAKNKENEITLAYFQDKVYNPDAQLTPMYTAYLGWLEDTYGMTEWRKKVVQADAVVMSFTEALIKETVMGVVDTAKFAFHLAVDPEKTTREVLDQANYLINHPEVLVEAAKTVYHNFEEGTPEERAAMLGSVASILVPGLSVTKSGKVGQVLDGVQSLTDKAVEGVKDLGKVLKNSEKFPGLNPFVTTPEGFTINFNAGKIPETNPLPKTSVQEHYMSEMDGLGDGKAGKIEGTGKPDFITDPVEMKKHITVPGDGFQAFLERKYIEIRKSGLDDIATVAKNTGLTEEQILKMKRHLFLDTKQLSVFGKPYEELYFQADPDIAHAWQKAQKGELNDAEKEWFRKLANHEIKEKEYMDEGMPLRDSSTWNAEKDTFDVVPEKNAHDKADVTDPNPPPFPEYDASKDFNKHYDKDIEY